MPENNVKKEETKELNFKDIDVKKFDISGVVRFFMNFLIPIVSIVVVGLLIMLVLYPSFKEVPDLQDTLEQNQKLALQLERKISSLELLVDYKSQVEENSNFINKTLVSDPLIPELLAQIDKMIKEVGLEMNSLGYSKGSKTDVTDYNLVVVSLSATGEMENILNFIENTEVASRLLLIDDFRLVGIDKIDESGFMATFKLSSPYLEVDSDAVTDESIDLNISDPDFKTFVTKLNDLEYYEISPEDFIEDIEETPLSELEEDTLEEEPSPEISGETPVEENPEEPAEMTEPTEPAGPGAESEPTEEENSESPSNPF